MKIKWTRTIPLVLAACAAFWLFEKLWVTVPTGYAGVVTRFGNVTGTTLDAGFHLVWPWLKIEEVSIRPAEFRGEGNVPTSGGMGVHLETSLIYEVNLAMAPTVYANYGLEGARETIVIPQCRSVLRNVTARYTPEALFTASRDKLEGEMLAAVRAALEPEGINVKAVLLRDVALPPKVQEAINNKMVADQENQRMDSVIAKEVKEAKRKRTEAEGIKDYQNTVQANLSKEYLIYKWIETLNEAAKHGSTMIYVPTGEQGLPTFKDLDRAPVKKP